MAFVVADRVRTTTTTTGTGTVTLGSAATGYQSFAAIGNANVTYYSIVSQTLDEWEVGVGTYTASGTTLSRSTVLSSSNSGSLVNFSAGTKDVFVTLPASRAVMQDDAGNTGVGTTAPSYKLDVRNNANSATYTAIQNTDAGGSASAGVLCVTNSGQGALRALSGSASFGWGPTAGTFLLESTAAGRDLWIASAQAINFGTANTARAAIDASGNFGIGTRYPDVRLDVQAANGQIKLTSTTGSNSVFSQYVNTGGNLYVGRENSAGTSFAAPAYSSVILSQGAYPFVINVNSGERLRITSGGDVGIGTASPSYKLHLTAASGIDIETGVTNTAGTSRYGTRGGGNAFVGAFTAAKALEFWSAGSQNMLLDASGNLGIGTTSPSGRLHVVTSSTTVAQYTGPQYGQIRHSDGTRTLFTQVYDNVAVLATETSTSLAFGTNNTERARIDASGNLLVGTTTTVNRLTVAESSTSSGVVFIGNALNGPDAEYGRIRFGSTASSSAYVNYGGQIASFSGAGIDISDLRFYTGNSSSSTERARIDASGNLLVGTTSTAVTANGLKVFSDGSFYAVQNTGVTSSIYNKTSYTSGTEYFADFRLANTTVGSISANGSTTSFTTSSDLRLKDNIAPADDAGSVIDAIQIVQYDWKRGGHVRYGVIAQDLNVVAPEAVTAGDDGTDVVRPWGVDYSKLVPVLIKEIQSLRARVAALEGG